MPSTRSHQQRRGRVDELVVAAVGAVVGDRAVDRVTQVQLAVDHVVPGRRGRVLTVGHEPVGARVQRVDHQLAVGRTGDLHPALGQRLGRRRDLPITLADRGGVAQEAERVFTGRQPPPSLDPCRQQFRAARAELAVRVPRRTRARPASGSCRRPARRIHATGCQIRPSHHHAFPFRACRKRTADRGYPSNLWHLSNDHEVKALFEAPNYAVISTKNPDGSILSTVVWISLEDGVLAVNSAEGRQWPTNLDRDGTVTVLVYPPDNPYEFADRPRNREPGHRRRRRRPHRPSGQEVHRPGHLPVPPGRRETGQIRDLTRSRALHQAVRPPGRRHRRPGRPGVRAAGQNWTADDSVPVRGGCDPLSELNLGWSHGSSPAPGFDPGDEAHTGPDTVAAGNDGELGRRAWSMANRAEPPERIRHRRRSGTWGDARPSVRRRGTS